MTSAEERNADSEQYGRPRSDPQTTPYCKGDPEGQCTGR